MVRRRGLIQIEGISLERSFTLTGRALEALLEWQPRTGEILTVTDREGRGYRARVKDLGEGGAEIFVFEEIPWPVVPPVEVILLQALPEKERMELIIEKATELGVSTIVPFKSRRSISLEERERKQKKAHRWPSIALRASKQSRRAVIPEIKPYCTFEQALKMAETPLKLMLWEGERDLHLRAYLHGRPPQDITLLVGPEGGFDDGEVEEARERGFITVSLGGRVLRTETASIALVGIVAYEFGL